MSETNSNDLEKSASSSELNNEDVHSFSWKDVTVTVTDKTTKKKKAILDNVSGYVKPGASARVNGCRWRC